MTFSRQWAMPNRSTFSIKPIRELLDRYIRKSDVVIDPFARDSKYGTITNDLNTDTAAAYHLDAISFLNLLITKGVRADVVLLDPPYSPTQIARCYQGVGRRIEQRDTQTARLYAECKRRMAVLLKSGGIAICCGWNSGGMGRTRGFSIVELLLVCHGGAHNDTIVTVERKGQ